MSAGGGGRRVLVTGAGGYIGAVLVPVLLEAGWRVRAVDRWFFGREVLEAHPALEVLDHDVRRLPGDALSGVDAVVDLAAISNDPSGEAFAAVTLEVNREARVRCAALARAAGVRRYVLPSSCSVYGFTGAQMICAETSPTNPLTTYARANLAAEAGVAGLAGHGLDVVVLRQATVFGASPRMRYDLAINAMVHGAVTERVIPLMRDGRQWRPFLHVRDAAAAILHVLEAPAERVTGKIFNVGSEACVLRLGDLADRLRSALGRDVAIRWYGDPDHRSYRVAFERIEATGWRARWSVDDGIRELAALIRAERLPREPRTITLEWYRALDRRGAFLTPLGAQSPDGSPIR